MTKNRRSKLRFEMQLELMYRTINRRQNVAGCGTTHDMSSKALLFQPGDPLFEGDELEVTIHWPALLGNTSRLNLVLDGRVTRCDTTGCVVSIDRYEFRTRATRPLVQAA
jgi:hypothetical protein